MTELPTILHPPVRVPWWCRTFGHVFITRPALIASDWTWLRPAAAPLRTFCRRCGTSL